MLMSSLRAGGVNRRAALTAGSAKLLVLLAAGDVAWADRGRLLGLGRDEVPALRYEVRDCGGDSAHANEYVIA